MSSFEDAIIQRIKQLEREVERLQRWERPIGGGGVTDHGQLTGLTDDDHTQYLNNTRHDTTDRHTLGTVVPHDSRSSLSNLSNDDHTQYTKHPASSTDNAIARWDGTGGRTIQNSGVTIDDSNNIKVGTAPVPTSVTSSTDNAIVRFDGTGGNKIQNSGVTIDDSNNLQVPGDYKTYKNSTSYTGYLFVPLTTPKTSTSWDGDAKSTTYITKMDLSSVFGLPDNIKAVAIRLACNDSDSAASKHLYIGVFPSSEEAASAVVARPSGLPNDYYAEAFGICPCDSNGDIYYQILASGTDTMDCWMEIYGYWI